MIFECLSQPIPTPTWSKSNQVCSTMRTHIKSFSPPTPKHPTQLSLENTSERLIKSIAELRRRIYGAKEKLEKEIQRKKCVEKSLSELRRDISRQKKIISTRRATPLPAIPAASHPPSSVRKSTFAH